MSVFLKSKSASAGPNKSGIFMSESYARRYEVGYIELFDSNDI